MIVWLLKSSFCGTYRIECIMRTNPSNGANFHYSPRKRAVTYGTDGHSHSTMTQIEFSKSITRKIWIDGSPNQRQRYIGNRTKNRTSERRIRFRFFLLPFRFPRRNVWKIVMLCLYLLVIWDEGDFFDAYSLSTVWR